MWSEVNQKREFCILGTRFFLSHFNIMNQFPLHGKGLTEVSLSGYASIDCYFVIRLLMSPFGDLSRILKHACLDSLHLTELMNK